MSKYAIKNAEGAQVAEAELADGVFGIEPNIPVIHQVVVCQDSCARQGTHSVKNRHMADIVHTYTEILLAGKKRFHVLDAESGNAKQMISVGASHNTCHLFTGKITTEGERWIVSGIFYT